MKTQTFENMSLEYKVPDETKIEDGKSLYALVILDQTANKATVTKTERTGKKTSERNYLYQGKNLSLTLNTDTRIARGTLVMRANEDWSTMGDSIAQQFKEAFEALMKAENQE